MEMFIVMGVLPIILLILGFPIFVILMVSSVITILFIMDLPLTMVQIELFGSVDNYKLIAVPFFIFAGAIMAQGGISQRLVEWVVSLMGAIRGSVALTTVGACTIFGAISGSSPATVAAIGGMLFPSLREKGYPEKFASGLLASSGAIAGIIPPSIAMILYGAAAEESVRHLFIAGVLPGLFIAFCMGVYIYFYARKRNIREGSKFEVKRVARTTKAGAWALGTPLIILGGIYAGIFSPTEAAGVSCLYAVIVAMWVYRDMNLTGLWKVTIESVYLTAQVLIIVGAATLFSRLLTIAGVPQEMVSWIQNLGLQPWMVLLIINIFLLAVGCVLDPASAILVLAPILKPVILAAGIDPIHFGIIMTVNVSIGMFTPPFGLNIFVTQALFRVPLSSLYPGLVPFIIINLIALGVISYWPDLSLILVRLLG